MSSSAALRLSDGVDALTSPSGDPTEQALQAVSAALDAIVPADGGGWVEVDLRSRGAGVRSFHDESAEDEAIARGILDTADDHPMMPAAVSPTPGSRPTPFRLSDIAGSLELHRTRAYRELLAPLGIEHQVFITTHRVPMRAARGWAINRSTSDFTNHEIDALAEVLPFLAVIDRLCALSPTIAAQPDPGWGLTKREREVLTCVADGWTAAAIGRLFGISGRTVGKHLEHAYAKLGCHDRVTAVVRFRSLTAP